MIELSSAHLNRIRTILRAHVPHFEVRAFGSRVNGTARRYSDLDLVIVGAGALDFDTLRHLKEAFEESDLPFRVDALDWHAISPEFQKVTERQYEIIQEGTTSGERAGADDRT